MVSQLVSLPSQGEACLLSVDFAAQPSPIWVFLCPLGLDLGLLLQMLLPGFSGHRADEHRTDDLALLDPGEIELDVAATGHGVFQQHLDVLTQVGHRQILGNDKCHGPRLGIGRVGERREALRAFARTENNVSIWLSRSLRRQPFAGFLM